MQFENLSNAELVEKVDRLAKTERELTVEVLLHLREVEKRGLHRELGYSSMFDYATGRLHYSASGASRRIRSSRAIDIFPDVLELLKSGQLSICVLSQIAGVLTPDNKDQLIEQVLGKSRREVELILAAKDEPKVRVESIRPVLAKKSVRPKPSEPLSLFSTTTGGRTLEDDVEPESKLCHEFRFTGDREVFDMVTQARSLLSGKYPHGVSLEDLFREALNALLDKRCPKRRQKRREEKRAKNAVKAKSPEVKSRSPKIPAEIKDRVFVRDGGQCSYLAEDGTKCTCTHDLEVHHIKAVALGGLGEIDNLKLVCRTHNILYAERDFGREKMNRFRNG